MELHVEHNDADAAWGTFGPVCVVLWKSGIRADLLERFAAFSNAYGARFPKGWVVLSYPTPRMELPTAELRKRIYAIVLDTYDAAHLDAVDALVARDDAGELRLDLPGLQLVRSYDVVSKVGTPANAADLPPVLPGHEVRTWRAGDRMRPARLKGRSRKLSDLFIDAKVPRAAREVARVIVRIDDQEIVWAEHVGPAFDEYFQDI